MGDGDVVSWGWTREDDHRTQDQGLDQQIIQYCSHNVEEAKNLGQEMSRSPCICYSFPLVYYREQTSATHLQEAWKEGVKNSDSMNTQSHHFSMEYKAALYCFPSLQAQILHNAAKILNTYQPCHKYFLLLHQFDVLCFTCFTTEWWVKMFSFLILGPLCLLPFYLYKIPSLLTICLRVNLSHRFVKRFNNRCDLVWIFIGGEN